MLKPTLLALTITSALLTACGGTSAPLAVQPPPVTTTPPVTAPPVVTPPPVVVTPTPITPAPPVTTPPVTTVNPPIAFDQHEITVRAGTSVTLTTNTKIDYLSQFDSGMGLSVEKPVLPAGYRDPVHVQVTAAPNAYTYDIYVLGYGLKDSSQPLGGDTYDWVKVHVVGSQAAPWVHPEAMSAGTQPVEAAFVQVLNDTRARGGTCTDPSTGVTETFPAVPPVTLNVQASGGLRMKAQDAVTRNWNGHVSPEGMGFTDFINMAGYTGFINEILAYGGVVSNDSVAEAKDLMSVYLTSYQHCKIVYTSAVDAGGQVAVGFFASPSNLMQLAVSFTNKPGNALTPILKLN